MGRRREATQVAEQARQRAPNDAMVNTVWGFLQLANNRIDEAREAFQTAIAQDSTIGLPHVGLGLALFRRNQTEAAVDEIRKATLLEPQVSLYNSYLGKAFYEIKDDRRAEKYLELAKQLDPRDPTPWLYDAIRLQSINQPIAAVENLQKSIELNDDRGVYRSRLLLDEDLAARATRPWAGFTTKWVLPNWVCRKAGNRSVAIPPITPPTACWPIPILGRVWIPPESVNCCKPSCCSPSISRRFSRKWRKPSY